LPWKGKIESKSENASGQMIYLKLNNSFKSIQTDLNQIGNDQEYEN